MKSIKLSVVLSLITALLVPALSAASNAQVVAEDPDGGLVVRGGSTSGISSGDALKQGDVVKSNGATLVVSICDGALVTIYPNSEVAVSSLTSDVAVLNLIKGELLGDTISGCSVSIANKAGTADISNGVYGVIMNQTGQGWTLQVRNLDGNVSFTGAPSLDTSNVTASIVNPGETTSVGAGEEITIRGTFDDDNNVFSLTAGGAVVAGLPDAAINRMSDRAREMNAIDEEDDGEGEGPPPGPPEFIDLPEQAETASDHGQG